MRRYVTEARYYAVVVQEDLFGEPVIVRYWGGRGSKLGGSKTEPYSAERLQQIDQERLAKGYTLLPSPCMG